MYVRQIDGKETTFGTTGTLWRDALVMYDRDTDSYWSQVNATAIAGPRSGRTLEEIPSMVTTWGEWKGLHPETLVLRKPPLRESPYEAYFDSPERLGASGRKNEDPRLGGKELVVGVEMRPAAAAVGLEHLHQAGIVNGSVGGVPVAWVALAGQGATAFDRRIEGRTLELARTPSGRLVDLASGSEFDPESGTGLAGPLAGSRLVRVPATRAYWYTWKSFHPQTEVLD